MSTYTVSAENGSNPKIFYEASNVNRFMAFGLATILAKAFRSIVILDDETGEVMYSLLFAEDVFSPTASIAEVIEEANEVLNSHY